MPAAYSLPLLVMLAIGSEPDAERPPVSERAKALTASALVFDGHNDLPWRLREDGDVGFKTLDLSKPLNSGHTDIPRIRQGGLKAQFWSVYIPSNQPNPARTVTEQIDLVYRMVERYPETFELATTADDVERIVNSGKVASLIGMEGGIAIENDLAQLRMFAKLGVRYMTLTHNSTLEWADAANDKARHGGLTEFGERVVREMNRVGMLVDISHVSPETMRDALRVSKSPVIASHSNAFGKCPHPRNIPDDVLKALARNGGVVGVNFYSGFVTPEAANHTSAMRKELKEKFPDPIEYEKAYDAWLKANPMPRATLGEVADQIDYLVKVAGIDHVGLGSDFDGIDSTPVGLEDVSTYPRLTDELLRRGYSEGAVRKILGENFLRALRRSGEVAAKLRKTTAPEVDQPTKRKPHAD